MEIPRHFPNVVLDEFVVMPNHIHGIVIINNPLDCRDARRHHGVGSTLGVNCVSTGVTGGITKRKNPMFYQSISRIIRWYKGRCSFEINRAETKEYFAWQPSFYDIIIRNKSALEKLRQYIIDNPKNWDKDENNI